LIAFHARLSRSTPLWDGLVVFVPFANAFGDAERLMLSAGSSD
jgi:hypothetical protein